MFQEGSIESDNLVERLNILPYKVKLNIPENFHLLLKLNHNKSNKPLPIIPEKNLLVRESESFKGNSFMRSYNFSWILCRIAKNESLEVENVVPQWSWIFQVSSSR